MYMSTTSRIHAVTADGHSHTVRICRGVGNTRYLVCDSCGEQRRAYFAARAKAEEHLATAHGARFGARQQLNPAPWIWGAATLVFGALFLLSIRSR